METLNTTKVPPCRCGYDSTGSHPCHGKGYMCRKPATRRLYNPRPACLAGMQMKFVATDTWACDECWADFLQEMDKQKDS